MSIQWNDRHDAVIALAMRPSELPSLCPECGYPDGGGHDCPATRPHAEANVRVIPRPDNPLRVSWTDVEKQLGAISFLCRQIFDTDQHRQFTVAADRLDNNILELQSRVDQLRNDWLKEHM